MHTTINLLIEDIKKYIGKRNKNINMKDVTYLSQIAALTSDLIEIEDYYKDSKSEAEDETVFSHIEDELDGAEEYLKMYDETKDSDFMSMSKDETKHAKKFLMLAKEEVKSADDKKELESLTARYNKILEKQSKTTE